MDYSLYQSICVQPILVDPHTLRTMAFRSAHFHTAPVCFFENFATPTPANGIPKKNALYDTHMYCQITPKSVVEFQ